MTTSYKQKRTGNETMERDLNAKINSTKRAKEKYEASVRIEIKLNFQQGPEFSYPELVKEAKRVII